MQELHASAGVLEAELSDYLQVFHTNAKNRLPKPNKQYLQSLAAKGVLQACFLSLVLVLIFIRCHAVGGKQASCVMQRILAATHHS